MILYYNNKPILLLEKFVCDDHSRFYIYKAIHENKIVRVVTTNRGRISSVDNISTDLLLTNWKKVEF